MLGDIFYFFGLFILLTNLSNLINYFKYLKVRNWSDTFKKVTGKSPVITDFRDQNEYNIFIAYPLFSIIQTIWLIFGIVSNSWYIFFSIIVLSIILSHLNRKINILIIEKITGFTFNLLKLVIVLLLIINHFHFHYDWIELFR